MAFRITYSDITKLNVDAIVNPSDQHYSGGGGVDRLIHELCGTELRKATRNFMPLHLGEAKATPGFALPCKYIIHTSGPKWRDSHFLEISLLGSCYRNSVMLAHSLGCRSIAFPLISSKGKHFPKEVALTTAIDAIMECGHEWPDMEIILTIHGKWAENLPQEFYENLSEYIEDTYEKEAQSAPVQLYSEDVLYAPEIPDSSLIADLLEHPTQKNLDKVHVEENFPQMLERLMKEKNISQTDIKNHLGISGPGLWKLLNGQNNPAKLTVFALAIEFCLDLHDTEDFLRKAGYAVNPSSMQDIILSGLIKEGIYDRYKIDDLLDSLDLQTLPGAV